MNRAVITTVASVLAALTIVVGAAGTALAADPSSPGMLGGRLTAGSHRITVLSSSTSPVKVTMGADVVTLSEAGFTLDPGETHTLMYSGEGLGAVTAKFDALTPSTQAGEVGSLTLSVNLKPYVAPFGIADVLPGGRGAPLWIVVLLLAIAFAARWVRRNVTISRKETLSR